ncbi:MAG: 4-hydroxy-3-methylbut-2-enyl diphosphate reductase [Planctomycetes bacterium]|nr:4-hydroxy-3-methylbut-2-enyl diphosphate reductase [Planctomycetota bacterium]MCC7397933.1 4-hydroxy-3-methylbut-2-enyl diphosphate reductase [Planctomycetota bacterium]
MQVLRADEMGMCFGVRDALTAIGRVADPTAVTMHGELVHNPEVLAMLDRRGFHRVDEARRGVPVTPVVLVTAHGVSDRERERLTAAGKQLLDTTCPLVQKAHAAAKELAAEGRRVVVIGRADHVEVRGLVEDLAAPIVVASEAEVRPWPERRLGVVSQTTTPVALARRIVARIRAENPHADVREIDTICGPTKARIEALAALLPRIDALVVVGGHGSNNTRQLVQRGEAAGLRTLHVEHAGELQPAWFAGCRVVGLTAGTSTLPRTIDEVAGWLGRLESVPVRGSA